MSILLFLDPPYEATLLSAQQVVLIVTLDAALNLSSPNVREALHAACEAQSLHYAYSSDTNLLVWRDGSYPTVPGGEQTSVTNAFNTAVGSVAGILVLTIQPYTFNFVFP